MIHTCLRAVTKSTYSRIPASNTSNDERTQVIEQAYKIELASGVPNEPDQRRDRSSRASRYRSESIQDAERDHCSSKTRRRRPAPRRLVTTRPQTLLRFIEQRKGKERWLSDRTQKHSMLGDWVWIHKWMQHLEGCMARVFFSRSGDGCDERHSLSTQSIAELSELTS